MGLLSFLADKRAEYEASYRDRSRQLATQQNLEALQQSGALNAYAGGAPAMAQMLANPNPAVQSALSQRLGEITNYRQRSLNEQLTGQQLSNARTGQQQDTARFVAGMEQFGYDRSRRPFQEREDAARLSLLQAQLGAAGAAGSASRATEAMGAIKFLSENYQQNMKAPVQVADAVQQVDLSLKTMDSLGALAAIVKLAKILDPESVVREGEVTTAQGGLGVAANLLSEFNRVAGKGLTPEAAKMLRDVVKSVAAPVLQRGLRLGAEYGQSASMFGVPGEAITTGVGFPTNYVGRYLQGFPDPEVETDF